MKPIALIEVKNQELIASLRRDYFKFEVPPNTSVLMHSLFVAGATVGYVATEDYGAVGGPHIYVRPECRAREYLTEISRIFKELYVPAMKSAGKWALVTNCDQDDTSTQNFLSKIGFTIKPIVVAEYVL